LQKRFQRRGKTRKQQKNYREGKRPEKKRAESSNKPRTRRDDVGKHKGDRS